MRQKLFLLSLMTITLTAVIEFGSQASFERAHLMPLQEMKKARYRLPDNTIPRFYRITIEPGMTGKFKWNGESTIDLEVVKMTKILVLHASQNLVIDEKFTTLVGFNGDIYKPIAHSRDRELEFLEIEFERNITVGNYSLNLKYTGTVSWYRDGLYIASIETVNQSGVVATAFEPANARQVFPCWDEPALKARYQLSIKHQAKYTAISNMPELERNVTADGDILTTFQTTPIMPTYSLTFVISDYKSITNKHGNVTVWARKNVLDGFGYMLDMSQKMVDVMTSYTGLPYGVPRLGSVMEPELRTLSLHHWGLLTYNEDIMRYNRNYDVTVFLDAPVMVMANGLAHWWFGNRVTPRWWDDLWLKEGFATYFTYMIMDEINKNWSCSEFVVVINNMRTAFRLENSANHYPNIPLRWNPGDRREIKQLDTVITYTKGAAILHMFRNALTNDVFRTGIQKFLTKHSYGAVETTDLTKALQEAYDEHNNVMNPLNIEKVMMPWLLHTGYPIIRVTRNYTTGDTIITQKRNIKVLNSDPENLKWPIPLNYATKSRTNFASTVASSWFTENQDIVTISGIDKDDWVIFNIQASGYYGVNYDDENWRRLVEYMNTDDYKNIHVLNRAQLINDAYYLAAAEPLRYNKLLWQLLNYLSREVEYSPWSTAKRAIDFLDELLSGTEIHETFQKRIIGLMSKVIDKVGYETSEDDDFWPKLTKLEIVGWACQSGHSGCSKFSAQRLERMLENPVENRLHPDNRRSISCAGLRSLNDTMAHKIVEWMLANDESLLISIIGCTENHGIHRKIWLPLTQKNSSKIDKAVDVFNNIIIGSNENFNFAVDLFMETHEALANTNHSMSMEQLYNKFIYRIQSAVSTKARLEKLERVMEMDVVTKHLSFTGPIFLDKAIDRVPYKDNIVAKTRIWWDELPLAENSRNVQINELR